MAMLRFLARRLGLIVLVMLLVSFLSTVLIDLIPGSPAYAIYPNVSDAFARQWNKDHGLDDPIWLQYWHWLTHALEGNLGGSWANQGGSSVGSLLAGAIPVTVEVAIAALVVSVIVAILLATTSALRPGGLVDRFVTLIASVSAATPPFVSSVFLVAFFSVHLGWLPSQGFVKIQTNLDDNIKSVALPVITLVLALAPTFLRVLRGDLVSILNEDFVHVARSRGLPEWYIMSRHVLRSASISLLTVAGISFGTLLGGAIIVEIFYGLPGLGNLVYHAVTNKDVPIVQGVVVCVALFFAVVNTGVDLLHRVLDPRVRSIV